MKPWQQIKSDEIVYNGWRKVIKKTLVLPNGETEELEVIGDHNSEAALVIALTGDNKVIVARQYRAGPNAILDELPGGQLNRGEIPDDAVLRELKEETGYTPSNIIKLGSVFKDGYFNYKHHFYLATDCIKTSETDFDKGEFIEVDLISIDQLIKNAKTGKMTDPAGVLMAYDELTKIKESIKDEITN